MAVLHGMPTIQYSARSTWLMVTHSGHLNLKIQTTSWDRNDVWDWNHIFWKQIAKFWSLMVFRKWNC